MLALAERLKKKNAPGNLYKSTTENISFFNRDKLFVIRKIIKISNTYHYWISIEGEDKEIDTRFLRLEFYALSEIHLIEKKSNPFSSNTIILVLMKIRSLCLNLAMEIYSKVFFLKKQGLLYN